MRRILKAIIKICIYPFVLVKVKFTKLEIYAVEMQVKLDENTILHKFIAEVPATSKRNAKWEAKQRCRIVIGAAANKKTLIKYNKNRH